MPEINEEASKFLKEHRLCVFATGRKDGSPQQSLIGYQFDGKEFLLGGQATSYKMKNLARNPGASMAILDGRGFILVYGKVTLVDDPAEMEKLQERFGPRGGPPRPAGDAPPAAAPPRPARAMGPRVNILLTPTKIIADRMSG